MVFWVLLFGYTLNYFAARYGVAYQFLYPEYMGENSSFAFAMVGFALGGFILAFNLYTYILHGFRFPFIATLNRPFLKFSVNNFIIPLTFVLTYIFASIKFQSTQELLEPEQIARNMFGFVVGMFGFLVLSLVYFRFTNKNLLNYEAKSEDGEEDEMVKTNLHRKSKIKESTWLKREWRVETYLSNVVRVKLARSAKHYNAELLAKVLSQNHLNASFFEILLIASFLLIGSLRENPYFVLPAAASVMLFFTMMLMIISALYSWIRGWTLSVFIILFALINYSMPELGFLNIENHAYGMEYDEEKASYSREYLQSLNANDSLAKADFFHTLDILDKWRKKNQSVAGSPSKKPKLVIINVSGGGSRSALWTMSSLSYADSVLGGKLFERTTMISGSSGGMIGASFLRELHLRQKQGGIASPYASEYREQMAKDLLNPVIFSIATNDFFVRYQDVEYDGNTYTKDRAWAFEKQLHMNTNGILNKRLSDYKEPEKEAMIPMMVFAPTITNDGRRLLISSQPVSYLTQNKPIATVQYESLIEDVEFNRLFENQDAMNVRFSSVLRMNATFPYVMPIVTLPSDPPVEVMDAGLRDNFGMKTTLQYLYSFRNWINSNTSGVIILQVRDVQRDSEKQRISPTLFNRIAAPLGSVYGNFTRMQDYNNDQAVRYLSAWFDNEIDVVTFQLAPDEASSVSLSWHLTTREKKTIQKELETEEFRSEVERLRNLIGN